jgi:bifunctional non-homologous end joining protein LigD
VADAPDNVRYVDHFVTAGDAVLRSACRMHLEGIVSKRLDAPYESGRVETWTKSKCRAGHEVVIGGYVTTGGAFRSLIAGVNRGGHLVHVGRIGTGFSQDTLSRIMPKLRPLETDRSPFTYGAPRKTADIHWLRPDLVAEIEYEGFTGDGYLRQAAFKGLREDKPAAEVEAELPAPASTALAEPAAASVRSPTVIPHGSTPVMGVIISNANKPLWPAALDSKPITKLDLARYYEAVGDWLIRHVRGRPCSMIRFPDGTTGKDQFFQRHTAKGQSSLISEVTVWGDRRPYLQFDRVEALIAAAQVAALELHPWNCEPFQPEQPGRLVFDLDPAPDVAFDQVIAAAREIRDRLQRVGLVSFCKTTGGKGLHVVTPLKADGLDWAAAKAFALGLAKAMASDAPDRYLINMAKKERSGRIFIDYLRNDRMATAVAPLSPRGRPGAPVSMPLAWSQVKKGLIPQKYTIRTVPALIAKLTAWEDYCEGERSLADAVKRLGKV